MPSSRKDRGLRKLRENFDNCETMFSRADLLLFIKQDLGLNPPLGESRKYKLCEWLAKQKWDIDGSDLVAIAKEEEKKEEEKKEVLQEGISLLKEEIQEVLLGPTLLQMCNSRGQIQSHFLKERALELGLPPYKILQACDMGYVKIVPGVIKFGTRDNMNLRGYKYQLTEEIGLGGYGVVYAGKVHTADKQPTGEKVAVKRYLDDTDYNEIDICMRFRHPYVMHALDIVIDYKNRVNLVMPFADMGDLKGAIENVSIPLSIKLRWCREILDGMAFIQSQGYYHCDLKAENVLLVKIDKQGDNQLSNLKAVVADMNLAYPYEFFSEYTVCGTNIYTSPEAGLEEWLDDREMSSQLTASDKSILKAEATRFYRNRKSKQISKTDMWLTGNTLLWLVTGHPIYTKDYASYGKYVLQHFQQGDLYFLQHPSHRTEMQELHDKEPKCYEVIVSMLQWDPSKRPDTFIDCLDMLGATITPGEIYEEFPSGDFSLYDEKELEELSEMSKLIQATYKAMQPTVSYQTIMNAITLLYRSWPARDKRDACGVQKHVAACVSIAEFLSYNGAIKYTVMPDVCKILLKDCLKGTESSYELFALNKSIKEAQLHILEYTRGTLRFPYLIDLCASEEECKNILKMSQEKPEQFIALLRSPFEMVKDYPKDALKDYLLRGDKSLLDELRKKAKFVL